MKTLSIRTYLLLLVLAMSIPLVTVVGLGIYADMQQAIAHTKASLRTQASTMAGNTGGKIANARETLERLAMRPLVRQVDPGHCDPILKDLLTLNPDYANVTYTNLDGVAVCSAVPQPGGKPVNVAEAPWFKKFVREKRFIVGQPILGPITHKWVSVLSAPIWNERREIVGGVQLPLDLAAFDPKIPAQFLPAGSRYGFFDADGVMIWRNLDPEHVIGIRPNADAARRIVEVKDGEFESLAVDGVLRFFAVTQMPQTGWIAFVGVPSAAVYGEAKRRAMASAAIAAGAIAILLVLAIAITRRIAGPIAELERMAHSVQRGELGARAAIRGPGEVVEVAKAFNDMAENLQAFTASLTAEIAERKQMEGQVRQLAFYDPLTQLPNRRLLSDRMSQAMAASKRSACYGALMFIDLDHFKPLNDTYGHKVGDLLLVEAAARLKTCLREMDTVARFGGDEFVAMISELYVGKPESTAQAEIVAEKIRIALGEPYRLTFIQEGTGETTVEHHCTACIGVALFINHEASEDDILKWADAAMYRAKAAGRNLTRFHDPADMAAVS